MARVNGCRADRQVAGIVGISPWAQQIRADILRVAAHDSSVLISGPTGTGKELVARAIHEHSDRAQGPFVPVDCAALPDDLFVSHMFGHVKGAFTGAQHAALGVFRAADEGTIFLDEIGEMALHLQAKLLRALQEKTVTPVGGHEALPIDARIVAATNRNLNDEVRAGRFRRDLYYRLNVVSLQTIPLNQRAEEVPVLAQHFLDRLAREEGFPLKRMSGEALALLVRHDWPGNVRELHHRLERALVFTEGETISVSAFPELLAADETKATKHEPSCAAMPRVSETMPDLPDVSPLPVELPLSNCNEEEQPASIEAWPSLSTVERRHIVKALERTSYNQTAAARLLSMDRHALRRKIKKYGIILGPTRRGRPAKR